MKRNATYFLIMILACIGMAGIVLAANDRYYTAAISPNDVPPGGLPTNFNLIVTNNIISGPSHFLRQIIVTVPAGFTITGPVTVQAPAAAPLPWKPTVNGNTITVTSGASSDASVTAGQSVTITVPAVPPSVPCPGGSFPWVISASQVVGGGTGNAYLPTPGSPAPVVKVGCDTQTHMTLSINPNSIITTNAAAMVTLTGTLTRMDNNAGINHEILTYTLGGQPVPCIGAPIYTDINGVGICSYYPQAAPNTPLPSGVYDALVSFAGDSTVSPHIGSSGAGPVKLNVNATGTGLAVASISVPYSTNAQPVTLSATLTANNSNPVSGKTVNFTFGTTSVGSGVTDASGVATVNTNVPAGTWPGTYLQYIKAGFAGDNAYSGANGDAPLTVGPIAAAISFDPASLTQTYTGNPLSPTVITNPPGLSYSISGYPQTNAGVYTVSATITAPSYSGTTGPQTFTINQALAAIVVTGYNVTYDGASHSVTSASATGVQSENLGGGLTLNTTHTSAGTYVDSWSFAGGQNYVSTNGSVTDVISKAGSSVTVTGGTFVYDTLAHAATAVATTTVGSLTNPNAVALSYSGSCASAPTTVTEGTSCTATGTYPGDANHSGNVGSASIVITKASSYVAITGGTYVWDGSAHPATAVAGTTVGSLTNPTAVIIAYGGSCGSAPTSVAEGSSCTATGTYAGDANHSGSSNSASITITKADQKITFTSMVVTATATGTVSFSSGTPNICSVVQVLDSSNNPVVPGQAVVTLLSGTWAQCSVLANQTGTADYNAAPQETGVLTVTP